VRTLLWPLFTWATWAQQATVLRSPKVRLLLWPLVALSAWAHTAIVVVGTTGQDAVVASVLSVGLGSTSHSGSGNVR
jgi:hypothetical protein